MSLVQRPGVEFIGELPGNGPWKLIVFQERIYAFSPFEKPRVVVNGKLVVIEESFTIPASPWTP